MKSEEFAAIYARRTGRKKDSMCESCRKQNHPLEIMQVGWHVEVVSWRHALRFGRGTSQPQLKVWRCIYICLTATISLIYPRL